MSKHNITNDVAHDNKLALVWCIMNGSTEEVVVKNKDGTFRTKHIDKGATVEDAIKFFNLKDDIEEEGEE